MPRADESSLADRDAAPAEITVILNRALAGDAASREQVYALLYAELVRLARSHLAGSGAVSLNPSATTCAPAPPTSAVATTRRSH